MFAQNHALPPGKFKSPADYSTGHNTKAVLIAVV